MTLYTNYKDIIKKSEDTVWRYPRGIGYEFAYSALKAQLRNMQIFYEKALFDIKENHKSHMSRVIYETKNSTKIEYTLKIEKLKLEHEKVLIQLKTQYEIKKQQIATQCAKNCKNKYDKLIADVKADYSLKISNLNSKLNNLSVKYANTLQVVKSKEAIIKEITKTSKEALKIEKKLTSESSALVKSMITEASSKIAKNKKIGFGVAGVVGAYMMMKN